VLGGSLLSGSGVGHSEGGVGVVGWLAHAWWTLHARFGLDAGWTVVHLRHLHTRLDLAILGRSIHRMVVSGIGGDGGWIGNRCLWFRLWVPRESGDLESRQLLLPSL